MAKLDKQWKQAQICTFRFTKSLKKTKNDLHAKSLKAL